MGEHQIGWNEGRKDRARADLVEIGYLLADLGAGKAAHRQQRDIHQYVGRYLADVQKAKCERDKDREHRQCGTDDFDNCCSAMRHQTQMAAGALFTHRASLPPNPFISDRMSRTRGASKLAVG